MKTVLFVEDEHALRAVFSEVLRTEGFVVLQGADLAEADQACKDYGAPIDLVILDAKNGVSAAKRLAAAHPGMQVLFVGAAGAEPPTMRVHRRKAAWLAKPFTAEALVYAVHSLIETGRSHART